MAPLLAQGPWDLLRVLSQNEKLSTWATPVWILCLGVLLGMVVLALLWGVLFLIKPRAAKAVPQVLQEGAFWWIYVLCLSLSVVGIVGVLAAQTPGEILHSLTRLPVTGTKVYEFKVSPASSDASALAPNEHQFEISVNRDELQSFRFVSDQSLVVSGVPEAVFTSGALIDVPAESNTLWRKSEDSPHPFPEENSQIEALYVRNNTESPATLTVFVETAPKHPEVASIPVAAALVVFLFLAYFAQRSFLPRASAIALSTAKSELAQPLFAILLIVGVVILLFSPLIPYFTLGDDIKMLKDVGFVLIMLLCLVQAIWAASTSVSEEIEGRTALTVLSKPVARWEFIFGKYMGILWAIGLLFLVLSVVFLGTVAYKPIYDAKETAKAEILWQTCHFEVIQSMPGLVITFLEVAILASISVAVSTRLPMLANFVICFAIWALGHLSPVIVQSSVANQQFEAVVFVARLIATVLPNLDHFNMQPAVATGALVPWSLIGGLLLYCFIYVTVAMVAALALFDDRDVG